jgi:hypothetical protein
LTFGVTRHELLAAMLLFSGACAADIGDSSDPELDELEVMTLNAMTLNAMTLNALTANFEASQEMVVNPLATESYDGHVPALEYQLSDALTQEFMHYLVGCALKPGQVVEYKDVVFGGAYSNKWEGQLGLCPDWNYGPADQTCQEVVSACLLSRVNAFGVSVELSIRGHEADGSAIPLGPTEEYDFPWREGAFFGDVFDPAALADGVDIRVGKDGKVQGRDNVKVVGPIYKNMYACVSSVWNLPDAYAKDRVCAGGSTNCAAKNVGACRFHQTFAPNYKCLLNDDPATGSGDKDYQACRDNMSPTPVTWKHSLTVFLDNPCALYPKGKDESCQVTLRNQKYGPTAWDAYDAKGQKQ